MSIFENKEIIVNLNTIAHVDKCRDYNYMTKPKYYLRFYFSANPTNEASVRTESVDENVVDDWRKQIIANLKMSIDKH